MQDSLARSRLHRSAIINIKGNRNRLHEKIEKEDMKMSQV